jgi:hypothetical protein
VRRRGALLASGLLLLGLGLVSLSCSSGDGNEQLLDDITPLQGTLTSDSLPGAPYVAMDQGISLDLERIRVNVGAVGVTDLWGLAFTYEFDPALLQYVPGSADNGGFLGTDSQVELIVEPEPGRNDRLVVGISKLRQSPTDTGVSGTGQVMTLEFRLLARGATTLDYVQPPEANLAGVNSLDQVILDADDFVGATVQIQ